MGQKAINLKGSKEKYIGEFAERKKKEEWCHYIIISKNKISNKTDKENHGGNFLFPIL